MNGAIDVADALRLHLDICRRLLTLVQQEAQALRDPAQPNPYAFTSTRKELLPRLNETAGALRQCRTAWQRLLPKERAQDTSVPTLIRQCQEVVMKILVLDRENEQTLLRRGLLPPQHLPPAQRQRPHYVADLYRRSGHSGTA